MLDSAGCRVVFRLFPKSWRADGRAAEALSIAADAAEDAGRMSLRLRDVVDLIGYAISVRAAESVLGLSRPSRTITAALSLISALSLSIALFVSAELIPGRRVDALPGHPGRIAPGLEASVAHRLAEQIVHDPSRVHPFVTLGVALYALWIITAIAVLIGSGRILLVCISALLLATVAVPVIASTTGLARPSGYDILALGSCAALLLFTRRPLLQIPLIARVGVVAAGVVLGAIVAAVLLPPDGVEWSGWGYWGEPQLLQVIAWTAVGLLAMTALGNELFRVLRGRWAFSSVLAMVPWWMLGAHNRLDDHRVLTLVAVFASWVAFLALLALHRLAHPQQRAELLPPMPATAQ